MSITSPLTDAASLISLGLATEPVVIRPKIQPARIARAKAAAAHCGVANGESNALSQFSCLARDSVSRLLIFDQTIDLKSVGRSGSGRLERAFRSSSKRDSFILLCRTLRQAWRSAHLLSGSNERKGLIPQNFGYFFHKQPLSSPQENAGNVFQTRIRNGTWRCQKPGALGSRLRYSFVAGLRRGVLPSRSAVQPSGESSTLVCPIHCSLPAAIGRWRMNVRIMLFQAMAVSRAPAEANHRTARNTALLRNPAFESARESRN